MLQLKTTCVRERFHPFQACSNFPTFWTVSVLLLAMLCRNGTGWSQQPDKPVDYSSLSVVQLVELADQGAAGAQNQLGVIYEKGLGVDKDSKQAAAWYRKAAEQGNSAAQSNLGSCLISGRGVERDLRQGIEWLERSAAQRDPTGLRNLGYAMEQGWLGKKRIAQAAQHYRQAVFAGHAGAFADLERLAKTDDPDAQYEFALLFEYGAGTDKDFATARQWQEKAAAQDHTDAILALGLYFQNGAGGPKDVNQAVKLFRTAAQRGNARGLNALAECYFNGTGLEKDEKKAVTLVKMAADQEVPVALTSYGWSLATGLAGDPDPDQAAHFYYRAATRGHQRGQKLLRALADEGNAVAADYLKRFEAGEKEDAATPSTEVVETIQTPESAAELLGWLRKYEAGEYNQAIDGLYEFVEKHPQDNMAWYLLGVAYQAKQMPWEAKRALDRAITLCPANPAYYISKAGLLEKQKRFQEAAETLEEAAQRTLPTRALFERLVSIESKAKRLRHVVQYGEMLWALQESQSAAFALAIAHHFLEDESQRDHYVAAFERLGGAPEKLQQIFAAAKKLRQDKETILQQLKQMVKRGEFETMTQQMRRYLNYDPCAIELWAGLGLFYLNDSTIFADAKMRSAAAKYKDYAEAIELLSTACYYDTETVQFHQKLAEAMVENGEFERAHTQYQKTMQLFPDVANTYSFAALLALKMGDYDEAVQLAERAREINSADIEVQAWLATVYHFAGHEEKRDEICNSIEDLNQATGTPLDDLFAMNKYWDYGYYGNSAIAQDLVHRLCECTRFMASQEMGTEKYRQIMGDDDDKNAMRLDLPVEELTWRRRQLFRACRAYLEQYPKSFYVQLLFGQTCSSLGRLEEADKYFQQSLETNPDYALTYSTMALSQYFRGNLSKAVQLLRQAHDKDPGLLANPETESLWRVHWLENDKRDEVGIQFANIFWEADKSAAWIPARLAECYHRVGNIEKRDEFLEHARKLGYEDMDQLESMIDGVPKQDDSTQPQPVQDTAAERAGAEARESSQPNAVGEVSEPSAGEVAAGEVADSNATRPPMDLNEEGGTAPPRDDGLMRPVSPDSSDATTVDIGSNPTGQVAATRPPVPAGHDRIEMEHYYLDVPEDWLHTGDDILRDHEMPGPFQCMIIPRERVFGDQQTMILIGVDTIQQSEAETMNLETVRRELFGDLDNREIIEQQQIRGDDRPAWRFRVRTKDAGSGPPEDNDFYFWHCAPRLGMLIVSMMPTSEERQVYHEKFTQVVHSLRLKPSHISVFGDAPQKAEKKGKSEETPSATDKYMPICDAAEPSKEKCKLADQLCRKGQYDEAIRLYNEAIQLDRSHVCAYTGIGLAEGMRGRPQMAMDQMNRTVDMFPDNARALIERGRYALTINRTDLAEKDFDRAIRLSYCARAYELRAYCFLERGRDQSAINYLDMAIKIYPDSAEAYRLRARARRGLGHHDQATADDAQAAEVDRNQGQVAK